MNNKIKQKPNLFKRSGCSKSVNFLMQYQLILILVTKYSTYSEFRYNSSLHTCKSGFELFTEIYLKEILTFHD